MYAIQQESNPSIYKYIEHNCADADLRHIGAVDSLSHVSICPNISIKSYG